MIILPGTEQLDIRMPFPDEVKYSILGISILLFLIAMGILIWQVQKCCVRAHDSKDSVSSLVTEDKSDLSGSSSFYSQRPRFKEEYAHEQVRRLSRCLSQDSPSASVLNGSLESLEDQEEEEQMRGSLHFSLYYDQLQAQLVVTVLEARELPLRDFRHSVNPFVHVRLLWAREAENEEEEEEDDEEEERTEGERVQGEGMEAEPVEQVDGTAPDLTPATDEGSPGSLLSPPSIPLLRATSLQDHPHPPAPDITPSSLTRSYSLERHPPCQDLLEGHVYDNVAVKVDRHIYENPGELMDATPDLILAVKPKMTVEEEGPQKQFGLDELNEEKASASHPSARPECMDRSERNSRALSLHNSITKILSETTDSSEEEWQSISDLATACRSILEALSREDRNPGDGSQASAEGLTGQSDGRLRDGKDSDSPGHLEEKVSQLEAMLKRLQDDLQKEKEDKAVLQAEVQSLRQNNQRLQEESQSTVARLIKVTELLCNVNKPC